MSLDKISALIRLLSISIGAAGSIFHTIDEKFSYGHEEIKEDLLLLVENLSSVKKMIVDHEGPLNLDDSKLRVELNRFITRTAKVLKRINSQDSKAMEEFLSTKPTFTDLRDMLQKFVLPLVAKSYYCAKESISNAVAEIQSYLDENRTETNHIQMNVIPPDNTESASIKTELQSNEMSELKIELALKTAEVNSLITKLEEKTAELNAKCEEVVEKEKTIIHYGTTHNKVLTAHEAFIKEITSKTARLAYLMAVKDCEGSLILEVNQLFDQICNEREDVKNALRDVKSEWRDLPINGKSSTKKQVKREINEKIESVRRTLFPDISLVPGV